MLVIPHTDEMIRDAHNKAKHLGALNNSILEGGGNAAGYMAEIAFAAYTGGVIVSDEQFDYDIKIQGLRIEIKVKRRTVPPKDEYDVSIAATSRHQNPDLYAFLSLQFDRSGLVDGKRRYGGLENIWLLGYKCPEDYFRDAELWMPGDVDPHNNFETHRQMYNLPIYKLDEPPEFGRHLPFWWG